MTTSRRLLALLPLCCLTAACGPAATPSAATDGAASATAQPPAAAQTAAPVSTDSTAAPGDMAYVLAIDFHDSATDTMRRVARPVPAALREAARVLIQTAAAEDDCGTSPESDRVYLADFDGDGHDEGLAIYTLGSCSDSGNNYVRNATWLQDAGDGMWKPVGEFSVGTKLGGNRKITRIDAGTLTLAGSGQPFDSTDPADTVRVPPRAAAR